MFSDEDMHGSLSSIYLGVSFLGHQLDQYSALADTAKYFREGNGTPLQYSCLENPMDGGAW